MFLDIQFKAEVFQSTFVFVELKGKNFLLLYKKNDTYFNKKVYIFSKNVHITYL